MKVKAEVFQTELQQQVRISAEVEGSEDTLNDAFTKLVFGVLVDSGEALDPRASQGSFEARRMEVSGFDWEDERQLLTLYISAFDARPDPPSLTKSDLTPLFARLERFLVASPQGLFRELEESTEVFDLAQFIHETWSQISALRLVVLTNRPLRTAVPDAKAIEGRQMRFDVWDLDRLERLMSSGQLQEPLDVYVKEFDIEGIDAIGPYGNSEYDAYLVVLPGPFLARIYDEFGPRLLELNVRSFLQVRGKTNQGIQSSLRDEPGRFFAYNNGLSMTATSVEIVRQPDGSRSIQRISGLQIVNGGQTTASLYHASRRLGRDISEVFVQAKLTVVDDALRTTLAPQISRFANTQNLIKMADFTANDPFHVELEKLSRGIWAPAPEGTREMTRWFYERSRGQYADALSRERTPAQKRQFAANHPRRQVFTKTDVAKFEHAWGQKPHSVALGAEKNFSEFSQQLAESTSAGLPDDVYFQHLVAKAILWKETETLVGSLRLGGYRSAVVAYTVALISNRTAMRVDLAAVWRNQRVPEEWSSAVAELAPNIHSRLVQTAGTRNVLEWAKKRECWEAILQLEWSAPPELITASAKIAGRSSTALSQVATSLPPSDEEIAGRALIESLGSQAWFDLSAWAKETGNLQSWQRSLAFSLGRYLSTGRDITAKQVVQGVKIAQRASELGFRAHRPGGTAD